MNKKGWTSFITIGLFVALLLLLLAVLTNIAHWESECEKEGYDGLKVGNFIQLTDEEVVCKKITGFNEEDGVFKSEYKLLSDLRKETDGERE